MKLTSSVTAGGTGVTSPRKYSHQTSLKTGGGRHQNTKTHPSQSQVANSNQILMQNTYITYNKQSEGYARAHAGRKSLNLPVRNSSHRSNKQ